MRTKLSLCASGRPWMSQCNRRLVTRERPWSGLPSPLDRERALRDGLSTDYAQSHGTLRRAFERRLVRVASRNLNLAEVAGIRAMWALSTGRPGLSPRGIQDGGSCTEINHSPVGPLPSWRARPQVPGARLSTGPPEKISRLFRRPDAFDPIIIGRTTPRVVPAQETAGLGRRTPNFLDLESQIRYTDQCKSPWG